jgi:Fe2+ or Zn2+ uptake regulation protein
MPDVVYNYTLGDTKNLGLVDRMLIVMKDHNAAYDLCSKTDAEIRDINLQTITRTLNTLEPFIITNNKEV